MVRPGPHDEGGVGCEGDHHGIVTVLEDLIASVMPAGVSVEVVVVQLNMISPLNEEPALIIVLLDDGGGDLDMTEGHVAVVAPGVAAECVDVDLSSVVMIIIASEHKHSIIRFIHNTRVTVDDSGISCSCLPTIPILCQSVVL